MIFLALASLVFYSASNWQFVALLLASVAFNYFIGWLLIAVKLPPRQRFAVLTVGVAGDLLVLGVFKYAGFLAANLDWAFSTTFNVDILLPVGISFYTFTQIAFLVDAYRGKVAHYRLPHYALFVTYFPHLIAGPILHHSDMIPQFEGPDGEAAGPASDPARADDLRDRPVQEDLPRRRHPAAGRACLRPGARRSFDQAWIGALAYTFQLYFDFSGYSDMAIGISLMFGIFLPLNFNSPLQGAEASSISGGAGT